MTINNIIHTNNASEESITFPEHPLQSTNVENSISIKRVKFNDLIQCLIYDTDDPPNKIKKNDYLAIKNNTNNHPRKCKQ